jgi:hypothetical protein
MLKALIASLDNNGLDSNDLRAQGLNHLIRGVKVYAMYSLKFEINRNNFKSWFKKHISENYDFFSSTDELNDYIDTIYKWYPHYLDHKTLVDKTASLKSDAKKWYKKNKSKDLKGFDRFYETTLRLFQEAYNVYDVVFYSPDAIHMNREFIDDRKSCYITDRPDYYEVISQMDSFYIMIYKNSEPLTRFWGVLSTDRQNIVIFNSYGHKFFEPYRLFTGNKDEFEQISQSDIAYALGIYVNEGDWLISKGADIEEFVYQVECPCCGRYVDSNTLEWSSDRLRCPGCNGRVYSSYYDDYIDEDDAVYSQIHNDYFYENDVYYSEWHGDYILPDEAQKVYNAETDDTDYVLKKYAVYSKFYDEYGYYYPYLISDQAIYSQYYGSYLLKDDEDIAFSKWLNSYININDRDLLFVNGDYIPISDVKIHFIKYKHNYYLKKRLPKIHRFDIPIKPMENVRLVEKSWA